MIKVQGLKKAFGKTEVLKDINAEIKKGEIISIIGPSGTGKSTFLRCLNLLEKPTGGEILIEGDNILAPRANVNKIRQKMGMVFQSFNLFSHLMVIENMILAPINLLGMSRQAAYDKSMELLDKLGLSDKAFAYPDELSGGQKQRVAIARALAMDPEIILFDEPTSALDPTMVGEVLNVIRYLASLNLTMIIVTHEMKFAKDVSTRIFYMDEGIIYEDGSPSQIFDNPQREKTRIFVNRLKSFEQSLTSKKFDFYKLSTDIEEFGRKQFISQKVIRSIELVFEELVLQAIMKKLPDNAFKLDFSVTYSEETGIAGLSLIYSAGVFAYNPFEDKELDEISQSILTSSIKTKSYEFMDNINKIQIEL